MGKLKKIIKIIIICAVIAAAAVAVYAVAVDLYVRYSSDERVVTGEQAAELEDIDYIVVLGCQVKSGGVPSQMLQDRVDTGVSVYELNTGNTLLMSGDHRTDDYNEVGTMERIALESGVPEESLELDNMGLSTYDSMWRLKELYGAKRIIIVTQEYHLYRSLYIARKMGMEAWGVAADKREYKGHIFNLMREILARNKDFLYTAFMPDPVSTTK